ncbi:alcohol dehydrogenase catalytic domain-containing protein [Evansella sp. AB-rgal1]|uniref:alcohol dehydrogenase catalytic domain-containing protein n=1 Tax=Evansella sp. AB-rgal1 TaxID=3242696 RepID=UPI00359D9066
MKAVTYQGIKKVEVKEVPAPSIIHKDDIIVKVTACSICGSDLHCYHGMIPSMDEGYIVGHEGIGVVEEVGKDVTKVKKGDTIIIPYNIACGKCYYCKNNLESQCINASQYEIGATYGCSRLLGDYDGTSAQYVRVPYANFTPFVVPENSELTDDELLLLTDALPTAFWAVEDAGVKGGDTVIIIGSGPIGLLTQKAAWMKGAERVIAIDYVDSRLEHARKTNKVEAYNLNQSSELAAIVKEMTRGGADVVIDCVGMSGKMTPMEFVGSLLRLQGGAMGSLELATQVVRKGGIIQVVGVYGTRYNAFPLGDLFSRNITLRMGMVPAIHMIPTLYDLVQTKQIKPADVISHHTSLEDAKEAYQMFDTQKDKCLKIIMKP